IIDGIEVALSKVPSEGLDRPFYQLFNIGNGAPVSLMKFIEAMERELGDKAIKNMMPMQPGDVPRTWADSSLIQKHGYESKITIDKGVKNFIIWYKDYFNIN